MKPRVVLAITLFVPGIFLVVLSTYFAGLAYTVLVWKSTSGRIIDFVPSESGDGDTYYYRFTFITREGKAMTVLSDKAYGIETAEEGEAITVYYDPQDPGRAIPASFMISWLILLVFFPFGLLLMWLGWPFSKDDLGIAPS